MPIKPIELECDCCGREVQSDLDLSEVLSGIYTKRGLVEENDFTVIEGTNKIACYQCVDHAIDCTCDITDSDGEVSDLVQKKLKEMCN